MDRILIVSGNQKASAMFSSLLAEQISAVSVCLRSGGEARRFLLENRVSLILAIGPLLDEYGVDFVRSAVQTTAGVLFIVRAEMADDLSEKLRDDGVLVLPSSMGRAMFFGAVSAMLTVHRRLEGASPQTEKLQNKIKEIRLVDRAKCLLIQYSGVTEQQAHRYIEKEAMDRRLTRIQVAHEIINSYENDIVDI